MGFLKYLGSVITGKIVKENQLVANHGIRICEKVRINTDPFLRAIVGSTAICTIGLLTSALFEIKKFKYKNGSQEPNPFYENLHRLNGETSYEMFKFVAGYFFALFFVKCFYFLRYEDVENVNEEQLKHSFFEIYEYSDEDKIIFNDLLEIVEKREENLEHEVNKHNYDEAIMLSQNMPPFDEGGVGIGAPEMRLYDYIFEKAYRMESPNLLWPSINFITFCISTYNATFPEAFVEMLHEYKK